MTDRVLDDAELPEGGAEAALAKGGGKKKLLILIGAPILALVLIGGGLWATGVMGKLFGGSAEKHEAHEAPAAPKKTVFYDLPDLLVNLSGSGRKTSFLKMAVSLELEDAADVPKLQGVMPRIIDNFQTYLRELRPEDLKGSAGMYRVREELLTRVSAAAAPAKVVDVLFKEMLVQ
jgi:flagellar FliL protein